MLSEATLAYARKITTALLGVDALYRAESPGGDGLAVVNLDASGELAPDAFGSYDDARRAFAALRGESATLPEDDRRAYYCDLCRSTEAFISWRREGLPFASQLREFLHVPAQPAGEAELDALQVQIGALVARIGYTGDLRSACASWEERNRVPGAAAAAVLQELLDAGWERTERLLVKIPAPRSDAMRVAPVSGAAYNARCDYHGRRIELNTDPVLTRPGLKHLAAHEGCPGHYLQFKLREDLARKGEAPADVLLSLVNSASSSIFEGIGDTGVVLLEWMESDDDRLQGLLNRHRAGLGTGAAWRLHELGWSSDAVEDWLRQRSLIGGEGWVANRMRFIAEPSRAALIWSYWWGEPLVLRAWEAVEPARRLAFFHFLHGRMHSNRTVGMFQ